MAKKLKHFLATADGKTVLIINTESYKTAMHTWLVHNPAVYDVDMHEVEIESDKHPGAMFQSCIVPSNSYNFKIVSNAVEEDALLDALNNPNYQAIALVILLALLTTLALVI